MANRRAIQIKVISPSTEEGKKILDDAINDMMKKSIAAAANNQNLHSRFIFSKSPFSTKK